MDPDTASSAIQISDWVTPELIRIIPAEKTDKAEIIKGLVSVLAENRGFSDPEELSELVISREKGISTTLDTGLSIPHARVKGHSGFSCVLGVIPHGISDGSGIKIRLMLVFFSPSSEEFFSAHLKFLRSVSKLFQAETIDRIAACENTDQAAQILKAVESKR